VNSLAHGATIDTIDLPRRARVRLGWLALILLWGAWLRAGQIQESLWLDELHTSWVVADGWAPIADRARAGNQSPLYFYLVWGVVRVLGHAPWTLRLLSLAAGLALIIATCGLVRRWSGCDECGLLTALLVASHPDCVFYAQEARPYALLQLSAVIHAGVFARLLERPTRTDRLFLVAGAVWLFYLHYTALLLLLAQARFCFLALLSSARQSSLAYRPRQYACDGLVFALCVSPTFTHLMHIARQRQNWARIVSPWPAMDLGVTFAALVALPLAALAVGALLGLRPGSFRFRSRVGVWSVMWWMIPWLLAWLSTCFNLAALHMVRYLVGAIMGVIVFAGLCAGAFQSAVWRRVLGGGMLLVTLVTGGMAAQWWQDGRFIGARREPWNVVVPWLRARSAAEPLPVLLAPGLLEDRALVGRASPALREYCLFPLRGLYRFDACPIRPDGHNRSCSLDSRQATPGSARGWRVGRDSATPNQGGRLARLVVTRPRHVGPRAPRVRPPDGGSVEAAGSHLARRRAREPGPHSGGAIVVFFVGT
jgi:mannosyltransferase